ncbi:hypothetical protein [Streptomyces longhuiensis]|uniref:hypothetical protein n=1 Tax=Streptomyces longhuiensis TaxID=2880933 RepID=UPI001D09B9BF|nr:hypothetical protein [Streptomyces longhuiensis]UDM05433.1 hypothetical protein LGI35_45045 [Streptomyces longhuiensis]
MYFQAAVGVQHGTTAWIGAPRGLQVTLIEVTSEHQHAVEELCLLRGGGSGRAGLPPS